MKEATTILILDDDPDICTMLKIMLEFKGFIVFTADNENQARTILKENKISLIIMDMLLSGSDGTDICRRLKNDPATSSIPILMFSAHPTARERCLPAGANEFISKPFEMTEMISKVNALTGD